MYSKMYWWIYPLILRFGLTQKPLSFATGDGLERTGGLSAIVQHETRCLEDGINKSEQDVTLVGKRNMEIDQ